MRILDRYIYKLALEKQPLKEFQAKLKSIKELEYYEVDNLENLRVLGLPVVSLQAENIALQTTFTPIRKQRFCIVDIETSGSKISTGQIIEIGALMVQDGKILKRFESFVHCAYIPENIARLTHISEVDLKDAPSLAMTLEQFRLFLGEAVFVAHNVNFDYYFISESLEKCGFGPLLNRRMCSIDLARKTLQAPKYGLAHLCEFLDIKAEQMHRAYSDAKAAFIVFQKSLANLPETIITTEDLIAFAKPNPPKKKKKVPKP
ncbi:MAG: 3'-5' exonuclease [Sulfurospirillum sp.]|nr:3'-5' exonuclease [Sulfurospirillum sp.]